MNPNLCCKQIKHSTDNTVVRIQPLTHNLSSLPLIWPQTGPRGSVQLRAAAGVSPRVLLAASRTPGCGALTPSWDNPLPRRALGLPLRCVLLLHGLTRRVLRQMQSVGLVLGADMLYAA